LWESSFVDPLLEAGYQVVTFDWRDVGLSTWRSFRETPYTGADLVEDVVSIIDDVGRDHPGFDRVHLIGYSMGGMVAQFIAGLYPERVLTLTTLSSGYAPAVVRESTPKSSEVWDFLASEKPDSDDIEAYLLRQWRVVCGRGFVFDDDAWSARIASWVARGHNPRCPHFRTVPYEKTVDGWISNVDERTAIVQRISVPTLVMHGDDDGMFTPGNADAIAAAVPHARVKMLAGRGHETFVEPLDEIRSEILAHLARA
jgi:pimeloyl-ACP methyl ester carboxylesterase